MLAQAQLDLTRYRAALARNAIAEQIVADQEKLVQQTEGTVKNDQGAVDYDQLQLDYCHIIAPISGQVGCGWWIRATSCSPPARRPWR